MYNDLIPQDSCGLRYDYINLVFLFFIHILTVIDYIDII